MELSKQVCTPEQAKKLKDLGVQQEIETSNLWWILTKSETKDKEVDWFLSEMSYHSGLSKKWLDEWIGDNKELKEKHPELGNSYAAFTVAELGVMLPFAFAVWLGNTEMGTISWCCKELAEPKSKVWFGDTQADVMAKCLIELLEYGHSVPSDINQRLQSA